MNKLRRALVAMSAVLLMGTRREGNSFMATAGTPVDPKALGPDGLPLIFTRIEQEDLNGVIALMNAGADLEAQGFFRATPVLSAGLIDYWTMVQFLLEQGANPAAIDDQGINLPWLTSQAKVAKGSDTEKALNKVRHVLNDRAMLERVYPPAQALELARQGKWPPW